MRRSRPFHPLSRGVILVVALLALAMRLVIPAGFMPVFDGQRLTVTLCTGHGPVVVALDSLSGDNRGQRDHDDGKKLPPSCGFGVLAAPALGTGDAAVVLAIIALLVALPLPVASRFATRRQTWLRPPLRGPPALAA